MRGAVRVAVVAALLIGGTGAIAAAQATAPAASAPPSGAAPAPSAPATGAGGGASGEEPPAAGAAGAPAPSGSAPVVPATGYGYSDHPASKRGGGGGGGGAAAPRKHHARTNAAVATLPGFEMLANGGSRLFVELTKQVEVGEREKMVTPAARGAKRGRAGASRAGQPGAARAAHPMLTFVLRGATVLKRNNENALVTVHFNTPVARARLVPAGRDLHFVVDLRADVKPEWRVVPAKEGSAILQIDFPKGDFLPAGGAAAPEPAPAPAEASPSASENDEGSR